MAVGFGKKITKKLQSRGFSSGRILDAGCGTGAACLVLASSFPDSAVTGIDLSDSMLEIARKDAANARLGGQVHFDHGDVQQLPYENHCFKVVLNISMFHLVNDPVCMLNEIERVLMPAGYFYICDLRRSWLGLVEKEIRSAFSITEALQCILGTKLRPGNLTSSLVWWQYEAVK